MSYPVKLVRDRRQPYLRPRHAQGSRGKGPANQRSTQDRPKPTKKLLRSETSWGQLRTRRIRVSTSIPYERTTTIQDQRETSTKVHRAIRYIGTERHCSLPARPT